MRFLIFLASITILSLNIAQQIQAIYLLNNTTNDNNPSVYCLQAPQSIQKICTNSLGWPTRMQLPNFLGHKSQDELTNEIASMAILNDQYLNKIECKALDQLKLMLCATVSPICLDLFIPPCKQLCLRVKSSCRSALQRHGLEWPKFLDCRRFPSSPDFCIDRQPPYMQTNNPELSSYAFEVTQRPTTIEPKLRATTKRKRKDRKGQKQTTTTPSASFVEFNTSSIPANMSISNNESSLTTTKMDDNSSSHPSLIQPLSTTISSHSVGIMTTTQITLGSDTEHSTIVMPTTMSPILAPSSTTTTVSSMAITTDSLRFTQMATTTSQPSKSNVIAEDLTDYLCSSSPEWLIKTKLTDNQLTSATKKRRIRVRSYRQIFGPFVSESRTANNSTTKTRNQGTKATSTSINVNLVNSTMFIYPMSSSLYSQLMTFKSPENAHQQDGDSISPDVTESKTSSKTYLLFGHNSQNGVRQVTSIVLWPGAKTNKDSDTQANGDIIKSYRKFKLRQSTACQQFLNKSSVTTTKFSSEIDYRS